MKRLLEFVIVGLCLVAPSVTRACGFCIEDKVAATYDHALVTRALDRGYDVLFLEVVGGELAGGVQWRHLISVVKTTTGVQRGSVRTSMTPPTVSFVFDRSGGTSATVLSRINNALQKQQLRLVLIRVLSDNSPVASPAVGGLTLRRD